MPKVSRLDTETVVLHSGLNLLSRVGPAARRRVLAYWNARAADLPLIDAKGVLIDTHPVDEDPPILQFTTRHRESQPADTVA